MLILALFNNATNGPLLTREVTAASYARLPVACNLTNWSGTQGAGTTSASNGTTGLISNNVTFTFAAPVEDWGTITEFGLFDALTGGNFIIGNVLARNRLVEAGDEAPIFRPGMLTLSTGV